MGLAELFLGKENPFSQYVADNKHTVHGAFAGLSQGNSFASGLGGAAQGANRGVVMDDLAQQQRAEEEKRVAQINQTAAFLRAKGAENLAAAVEGGMTTGADAFNQWYSAQNQTGPSPIEINGQLVDPATGQVIGDYRDPQGAGGNVTYGVNPIYGMLEDGTMGMGVMGDDGTLKRVDTGGLTPLGPYDTNALKAAGTAYGKGTGQAQFDVPAAELTMHETLGAIQDIRNNKAGMEEQFSFGGVQQMLPAWPGSEKANFRNAVTRGADQAFLQAREMLRGGGQITDFEGRKAENAITNMTLASQSGNKDAFEAALNDFEQAVQAGYAKLVQQSSTMPGFGGQQSSAAGQNFVYNPATGQLEPQ